MTENNYIHSLASSTHIKTCYSLSVHCHDLEHIFFGSLYICDTFMSPSIVSSRLKTSALSSLFNYFVLDYQRVKLTFNLIFVQLTNLYVPIHTEIGTVNIAEIAKQLRNWWVTIVVRNISNLLFLEYCYLAFCSIVSVFVDDVASASCMKYTVPLVTWILDVLSSITFRYLNLIFWCHNTIDSLLSRHLAFYTSIITRNFCSKGLYRKQHWHAFDQQLYNMCTTPAVFIEIYKIYSIVICSCIQWWFQLVKVGGTLSVWGHGSANNK